MITRLMTDRIDAHLDMTATTSVHIVHAVSVKIMIKWLPAALCLPFFEIVGAPNLKYIFSITWFQALAECFFFCSRPPVCACLLLKRPSVLVAVGTCWLFFFPRTPGCFFACRGVEGVFLIYIFSFSPAYWLIDWGVRWLSCACVRIDSSQTITRVAILSFFWRCFVFASCNSLLGVWIGWLMDCLMIDWLSYGAVAWHVWRVWLLTGPSDFGDQPSSADAPHLHRHGRPQGGRFDVRPAEERAFQGAKLYCKDRLYNNI